MQYQGSGPSRGTHSPRPSLDDRAAHGPYAAGNRCITYHPLISRTGCAAQATVGARVHPGML